MYRSTVTILVTAAALLFIQGAVATQSAPRAPSKAASRPKPSPIVADPKADAAWKKIGSASEGPEPINGVRSYFEAIKKWDDGTGTGYLKSPDFRKWVNLRRLRFREEGLKFWREFPNDRRRYTWLNSTLWSAPSYWKDPEQASRTKDPGEAPIDEATQKAWDDQYVTLRAEFMIAPNVTDSDRIRLRTYELADDMFRIQRLRGTLGYKASLTQLANRLFDLAPSPDLKENTLTTIANVLLYNIGDDHAMESAVIEAMKLSSRTELQLFGAGRGQMAALRNTPMELNIATMKGDQVDLAKLRGKVVLVDVWSNYCTSCILAMPKVQAVYDKYRDKGFEVVGVWLTYDEGKEKPVAQKILADKGVKYPNGVIAGQANTDFCKKYSIIGVPVTFLLDRDGKLVTNDVTGQKLEQEVKRLIESSSTKIESK